MYHHKDVKKLYPGFDFECFEILFHSRILIKSNQKSIAFKGLHSLIIIYVTTIHKILPPNYS